MEIDSFDNLIDKNDIICLDDATSKSLKGPLEYKEVLQILKETKNNKSPGLDGFTYEFYKFFWLDLSYFLIRSPNFAYESEKLSTMQRQGVITLLSKGNKPRPFLKNWRPISLLNTAYKLASSVIACRIKKTLPALISEDQKGFLPGEIYWGKHYTHI